LHLLLAETSSWRDNDDGPLQVERLGTMDSAQRAAEEPPFDMRLTASPFSSSSYIWKSPRLPTLDSKPLFVAVFTVAKNSRRRALVRASLKAFGLANQVSTYFVMGKTQANDLAAEQQQYGDLMILTCEENMNEGKTLHFFREASELYPPHQFYLKVDDDTYLHLPDALSTILSHRPLAPLYYGRAAGYYYKNFRGDGCAPCCADRLLQKCAQWAGAMACRRRCWHVFRIRLATSLVMKTESLRPGCDRPKPTALRSMKFMTRTVCTCTSSHRASGATGSARSRTTARWPFIHSRKTLTSTNHCAFCFQFRLTLATAQPKSCGLLPGRSIRSRIVKSVKTTRVKMKICVCRCIPRR